MKRMILLMLLAVMILPGCTTLKQTEHGKAIPGDREWALLPFINNTETPYAAERAEAITQALLFAGGVQKVTAAPVEMKEDELLPDRGTKRYQKGLEWARKQGINYAVTGTVTEWRYKVGLDGEPVAGMTLQVMELPEGRVLWSGSAGRSGWSRDAVSSVAQQLLQSLVDKMPIQFVGEQKK
ncbi:MAG: penicillin-binding protein activator LpoB [Geobacter sp.]|nr:penicillin-binding protein activator LpoB [Geobacter sp.]